MLKLYDKGVYLLNGTEIVEEKEAVAAKTGKDVTPQEAAKNTMAYNILAALIPQEIWIVCRSSSIS